LQIKGERKKSDALSIGKYVSLATFRRTKLPSSSGSIRLFGVNRNQSTLLDRRLVSSTERSDTSHVRLVVTLRTARLAQYTYVLSIEHTHVPCMILTVSSHYFPKQH